ncbi:electron transport complex subunit RsxG [Vibrio algarum]|uniref:Ion-translocating oxidoreductase complex subunit G n=1 Tax=Vibrio algarum TaxID=3020714 RepID=A0ABT4YPZ4_9VIBR|nr:electron transport complex subunit RsxG [Vibrio sp. KJ40-1]MDB1123450.1 electron transport complex subunit RsxG [Vibrio sp. KJ40-1]
MLTAIKNNGATLAIFACACTGLVSITHLLTEDTILSQEREQLKSILNQVIPHKLHDNELYAACTLIQSESLGSEEPLPAYVATKGGIPSAIAIEAIAPDGYNGRIKLIVGIDYQGVVTGTRVLAHNETPGLGDKIDTRITYWIDGFKGKKVTSKNLEDWKVKKDGGQFDQFTGATITPRAVVNAVKKSVIFYNENRDALYSQPLNCGDSND